MAFMEWDNSLSVGNTELDEQHQYLINIVNTMYNDVESCQTIDEERVLTGKFLKQLQDYSIVHFSAEEKILEECNYAQSSKQQEEHNGFITKLQSLINSYTTGEQALSFDVFIFARDWIVHHIKISDMQYKSYINN